MLHKFLGHERTAEGINFVGADFFEKNDIYHWQKSHLMTRFRSGVMAGTP